VTDTAWIDAALTSARPQAVGALLRYFRNLDTAEEAFQNACLRALKNCRKTAAARPGGMDCVMVGRNCRESTISGGAAGKEPAARGRGDLRPRRRRGGAGRAARRFRITATTSCGCCSSAAIPICRRRSRIRWRCAVVSGLSVKADRARIPGV